MFRFNIETIQYRGFIMEELVLSLTSLLRISCCSNSPVHGNHMQKCREIMKAWREYIYYYHNMMISKNVGYLRRNTHSYVLCLMSIAYKTNTFHNNKFLLIKIPFICSTGNCFTYLELILLRNVALQHFAFHRGLWLGRPLLTIFFYRFQDFVIFASTIFLFLT